MYQLSSPSLYIISSTAICDNKIRLTVHFTHNKTRRTVGAFAQYYRGASPAGS
jgi:hypothetical protein